MAPLHNFICLETEWYFRHRRLMDQFSSEPVMQLLKGLRGVDYIYKRPYTQEELVAYLKSFSKKAFDKYDVFYLPFHGVEDGILIEGKGQKTEQKILTLEDLAELSNGAFENKIVHFSSCETFLSEESALRFKKKSKAKLVSGYITCVDVIKSVMADLAYMDILLRYERVAYAKKAMFNENSELCKELGLKIY